MALTRDKQILVGVVVLAGLGGLTWRQMKLDERKGTAQAVSSDLPSIGTSEEVDKIAIKNGDKSDVVLEKKGDKWMVTKPVEAPASEANVKSLLENMKELKAKEVIAGEATDDLRKSYELDATKGLHVTAWKGGEKKVDDVFGKSGGRGEMVMIEGKQAIYAAAGYSSYLYAREPKNWRDTEIFKFEDTNATQLTIENPKLTLSCTKGDKWACTNKGKPVERFDEPKVADAVRAFKTLNADDFGDGKPPSETGLDAPEAKVTIVLKDNAGKYVLKVGKTQSGAARYAQKEGDPTVFVIGSWTADWATAGEDKFQQPKDAGAPKDAGPAPKHGS